MLKLNLEQLKGILHFLHEECYKELNRPLPKVGTIEDVSLSLERIGKLKELITLFQKEIARVIEGNK